MINKNKFTYLSGVPFCSMMNIENDKISKFIYVIIILLPFLFFNGTIPFIANMTIGGDYPLYSIRPQMELLFSIKTGSFPLYVPGFAGGQSSSALTLAQIFHPLSWIVSVMPGYWDGKAIEWNNLFKLLSIGIAHLSLFYFLKKIRLGSCFAFLFSLITVYNLRLIDLYRYGAPLEAYTAFYMLCSSIGCYFTKPTKWVGPLCIMGTTYLLVCSGHPQTSYFGLIGAALYMSVIPFFLSTMFPEKPIEYKAIMGNGVLVCSSILIGILLSAAYVLPIYFDFIKLTTERIGQDYVWANSNLDVFAGTLNNFILPLHSDPYGAFGGSSLILLAVVLPILRPFKIKIPPAIWSIWGLLFIMFLFMQGDRTPIHRMAWEYMPFASSIRVPGRISLIMPLFIMLILAWIVKADLFSPSVGQTSAILHPVKLLTYVCLVLMTMCFFLYIVAYNVSSLTYLQEYFQHPIGQLLNVSFFWISLLIMILGIISLILFYIYTRQINTRKVLGVVLIIVLFMQLGIVLKYRSAHWLVEKHDSPTFEEMFQQKKAKLDYPYYAGGGLHSSVVITQINESFLEPFLGKIFTHVVPVDTLDEAYKRMRRERWPHQIFVEGYNNEKAAAITERASNMKSGNVTLTYSSFNRLRFEVTSEYPALFGLSYPYTGYWNAWVNGNKVRTYMANGAGHAIEVSEGKSMIEFRYWSSAVFWGMIISVTTFTIIGLFVCFDALYGFQRIICMLFLLLITIGGFAFWYNSLYNGNNLKTAYSWTFTSPPKIQNIAYGKKSWLNSEAIPMPFTHTRKEAKISKSVDGDRTPDSGLTTLICDNPTWFLDLNTKVNINKILLYESSRATHVNKRPLTVAISSDGSKWRTVASVVSPLIDNGFSSIIFKKPEDARFIKIVASGTGRLSFDEIEVYGP